jgi:3-deoxy-D-manno-octulosonate 8-phosphate phosphatase (KDO 8-P phosphatase)
VRGSANSDPEAVLAALTADKRAVLAGARLLALDVDGCLTDGRVVLGPWGEVQAFCVHDGQGLKFLQRSGVEVAWITGRGSQATELRAHELGVKELHMRVGPKQEVLEELRRRLGVGAEATLAMGDDLADLGLARASGFFCAPANARAEVRAAADLVTSAAGGAGAVRELCELVLRAKGVWQGLVEKAGG